MKKFVVLLLLTVFLPVFALRPGDRIGKPDFPLKWIDCTPFKIGELTKEEKAVMPALRILVFMFTRSDSSNQIIRMLEQLRLQHRGKVMIAVITPDTELDARVFHKANPDVRVRLAVDADRKLTPLFMAGSMLYPMGFICDADGKVLWNGEAVDLAEATDNIFRNKSNIQRNRQVALLLDDMQQRMRTGEIRPLRQAADKIFKLDPANPSALRMMSFVLESSGDISGAWELLRSRIKAAPGTLRLYYTAIDMMRRHPQLRQQFPEIVSGFYEHASTGGELVTFGEALLLNFAGDVTVLEIVLKQFARKSNFDSELQPADRARYYMMVARLRYLMGDLEGALKWQQKSVETFAALRTGHPAASVAAAQLKFYRKLKELRSVKF